jgi:hypothetical protein
MIICAGLALAGGAGCGSDGTYPVSGQLVYEDNQQPVTELAGFSVTFTSQALGKSASGTVGGDGTFRLTSVRPNDGAFPGTYKVIVSQPHPNPERVERRSPVVDLVYENPSQTPLERAVEPKSVNEFVIPLKRFQAKPAGQRR